MRIQKVVFFDAKMGNFFRETIVMQKFRQNDSFIKQNSSLSRDDFFRENNEFYY